MARLDASMCKSLNEDVISKLHSHNTFTVYDFLQQSNHELSWKTGLSFKLIDDVKENFRTQFAGESASPHVLYDIEIHKISTGIDNLDSLLEGGLQCGSIYEFCGSSSSGKSQLCHWISCHSTLHESTRVHYIDACRNFSANTIQMILDAKKGSDEAFGEVMSGIKRYRVQKMDELFTVLDHLSKSFTEDPNNASSKQLVVIDSLAKLCRLISLDVFNLLLNNLASMCRYIVNHSLTAILIVNTLRGEYGGTLLAENEVNETFNMQPSLGNYWMFVPNVRLLLSHEKNRRRKIAVWKSPQLKDGRCCLVDIMDEGVFSVQD